jgi:hypothetical protein
MPLQLIKIFFVREQTPCLAVVAATSKELTQCPAAVAATSRELTQCPAVVAATSRELTQCPAVAAATSKELTPCPAAVAATSKELTPCPEAVVATRILSRGNAGFQADVTSQVNSSSWYNPPAGPTHESSRKHPFLVDFMLLDYSMRICVCQESAGNSSTFRDLLFFAFDGNGGRLGCIRDFWI